MTSRGRFDGNWYESYCYRKYRKHPYTYFISVSKFLDTVVLDTDLGRRLTQGIYTFILHLFHPDPASAHHAHRHVSLNSDFILTLSTL